MADFSEITTILDFLGEENEQKIKDALTDAIICNLEESVNSRWFVSPDTLTEQLEEAYLKLFKKYKKQITAAMEEKMLKMIENIAKEESEPND